MHMHIVIMMHDEMQFEFLNGVVRREGGLHALKGKLQELNQPERTQAQVRLGAPSTEAGCVQLRRLRRPPSAGSSSFSLLVWVVMG